MGEDNLSSSHPGATSATILAYFLLVFFSRFFKILTCLGEPSEVHVWHRFHRPQHRPLVHLVRGTGCAHSERSAGIACLTRTFNPQSPCWEQNREESLLCEPAPRHLPLHHSEACGPLHTYRTKRKTRKSEPPGPDPHVQLWASKGRSSKTVCSLKFLPGGGDVSLLLCHLESRDASSGFFYMCSCLGAVGALPPDFPVASAEASFRVQLSCHFLESLP